MSGFEESDALKFVLFNMPFSVTRRLIKQLLEMNICLCSTIYINDHSIYWEVFDAKR